MSCHSKLAPQNSKRGIQILPLSSYRPTQVRLHYFASTTVAGTPNEEKVRVIGKTDKDLIRFLDERCPTKAVETLGMIILTTHTTLMRRTVSMTPEGHRDRKKLRSKGITLQETFEGRVNQTRH
ncbi:hypothetical protein KCU73_g12270, partial [Aureobasidium melanogenum]